MSLAQMFSRRLSCRVYRFNDNQSNTIDPFFLTYICFTSDAELQSALNAVSAEISEEQRDEDRGGEDDA